MNGLIQDVRYALRQLRKNPAFTAITIAILALGIGANTAIFSIVDAVLLRPLPYKDADKLLVVWQQNPHRGWFENNVSGANFVDWKKQNQVFSDMAAFESNSFNVSGDGNAEEVPGQRVTTNLLSLLAVQPLRGRLFLPEEERQDKTAVIISYGFWQKRFGGDPQVVGKRIVIDGQSDLVVGVLPAGFEDLYSARMVAHTQLWISGMEPFPVGREFHRFRAIARLKLGVTLAQAQADMDTIANRIEQQYPESKGWGVSLVRLHDQVVEKTRPALLVLLGAVALVLLIACANVANLLLVRASGREKEVAVRTALGANRGQLVRQFLVESTVLALFGATAGLGIAFWGSDILVRLSPPYTPRIENVGINAFVLAFAFLLAVVTGIVFGLFPALSVSRFHANDALKESGRSLSTSREGRRVRDLLVIAEFGLALALLIGAGLMIKALAHLRNVEIGFNPNNLLSFKISLDGPRYTEPQRQVEFFEQLVSRIEAIPGVRSASVTRGVPMEGWAGWNFVTADNPNPSAGDVPDANYIVIGPHYFDTLQIPLSEGRRFTTFDTTSSQPVAIVSEALAQKYWHGQDPIGKRIKVSGDANDKTQPWLTVIGVAGNVRTEGQYAPFLPEIYVPYTQYPWVLFPRNILVRTSGDSLAIVPQVRREAAALDKDVPVSEITPMSEVVAGPVQQGQTIMRLLEGFATLALVLAAVGIYSVISYAVSQRRNEIGVRMALGATRQHVAGLIMKQGLSLTVAGMGAGLLGALLITRAFGSLPFEVRWLLLYDVHAADPLVFGAVSAALAVVALVASYIPARRAAKVDPMVALRYE